MTGNTNRLSGLRLPSPKVMVLLIYPKRAQVRLSSNLRVFIGLTGGFSPKVGKYCQIECSDAPFICSDVHLFVLLD